MKSLFLSDEAAAEILAHARDAAPRECCGLLLGAGGQVRLASRARNASAGRTRFLIDPQDHFAALRHARDLGLLVIGWYHSHPSSPAAPSPRDIEEADGQADGSVSVIAGRGANGDFELAASEWTGGNFLPLALVRIPK